ncbi:hypothetical protein JM84_1800 [Dokdonia sp. Hel_I_63]|uniref:hypothetical protein n=1 Tax=Dokdonia sp. Hel_I_63 TaxID=1249996 RepID=UPI001199AE61|nr:hypothetical protein [Dokdonia sp. Hel_I_63]TVZ22886.1 hypothetical protein JM84_1800 [Dokdonia sp. Hel_I_63]
MESNSIKENYKNFTTEELLKLVLELKSIKPEYIPLLQEELIDRNEIHGALDITKYLISIKYHISDDALFDTILSYRKSLMSEDEIDIKLKEDYGISPEYAQLIHISLQVKGKENIAIGIAMIILPLIFGLLLLNTGALIGIIPLLLIGIGIWRLKKGIDQSKTR